MVSESYAYGQMTRWILITVLTVILLIVLWTIRSILLLTLASVVVVILLTMPVRVLMRFGIKRGPAVFISLVGIIALILLLMIVALPTLLDQFTTLATQTIPAGVRELGQRWESGALFEEYPFLTNVKTFFESTFQTGGIDDFLNQVTTQLAGALGQLSVSVISGLGGIANAAFSTLIVVFLSMYFIADPQAHEEGLIKLFPIWYRPRVREILDRLDFVLRNWLRVQLFTMLFVGVITWFGLALIGLREAAALGVLAGLFSFVPNFGEIAALIPSIVVGFVQAPQNLIWIILIIYGTSFFKSQVLAPLMVAESIKLPAVLVLLGQIIAGVLFGFMGILLAVPMAAIVMVLVQEVYIKDMLGDRPERIVFVDEELLPDEA